MLIIPLNVDVFVGVRCFEKMNVTGQQYICELITNEAVLKQFVYFAIYINIKAQTLVNRSYYL